MLGGGAAPKGLAPLLFAHLNLLMTKEKVGIERAVVASALASGQANNRTLPPGAADTQQIPMVSCHDIAGIWVAFFLRCQRYCC